MKFKINKLTLICKESVEVIDISAQINFFYGPMSTGKSSIARIIDYCFGGKLEKTKAISDELLMAKMEVLINGKEVIFERALGANQIRVTWTDFNGVISSLLAPMISEKGSESLIESSEIFNFSDLVFYLSGKKPVKVLKSKTDDNSPVERLSFQNLMWYCYLEQDHLESNFYCLHEVIKKLKSRDVIKYILGYDNTKILELQSMIAELSSERQAKADMAKRLQGLFDELGFDSEAQIQKEIEESIGNIKILQNQKVVITTEYKTNTHFSDSLREELFNFSENISASKMLLHDLENKISEQKKLKSEFISSKYKLAKSAISVEIFNDVKFESCPCCGVKTENSKQYKNDHSCYLCGAHESQVKLDYSTSEILYKDLDGRLEELDYSLKRLVSSKNRQKALIQKKEYEKSTLDEQLQQQLVSYDSDYIARTRHIERATARLQEKVNNLKQNLKLPQAVQSIENEADDIGSKLSRLRKTLAELKNALANSDDLVEQLEQVYRKILISVGVPEVRPSYDIKINRSDWIPYFTIGEEKISFYNGFGSGGVKTLLNVCYAIALHDLAATYDLPLPSFLIIDTPMKNVSKQRNREVFIQFYKYLYQLINSSLADTQIIIIDDDFVAPDEPDINIRSRLMTKSKTHPPLISYYELDS